MKVPCSKVHSTQPCQKVPAAGNFAAFSPFLAAYSTLDFTMSPLAGKGTSCLLPTTPSMLPTATGLLNFNIMTQMLLNLHEVHMYWENIESSSFIYLFFFASLWAKPNEKAKSYSSIKVFIMTAFTLNFLSV